MYAARVPNQPIYKDEHGTSRFRANEIVRRLLEDGPFDMNQIALWQGVSDEDRAQFAQLIGYSVSGWGSLSYVTPEQADEAGRRALAFSWISDPEAPITLACGTEAVLGRP